MRRFEALAAAKEAIDHADELTQGQKYVAKFILTVSPFKRRRAVDLVTEMAQAEGAIDSDGNVEAAVDWVAFLKLILPLLLALL